MTHEELMKPENIDLWARMRVLMLVFQLMTVGVQMGWEGDES